MIYFDSGATTLQKPASVSRAVVRAMNECASPGRGGHRAALRAAETVYELREAACRLFNFEGTENVVLTGNATHGLNIAIKSLVPPGGRTVVSAFEHNSVVRPLRKLGAEIVTAHSALFDSAGTLAAFENAVTEGTDAVICTHVSNAFGFILPVYEIARLCRERGVPFVLDASQSAGCLKIDAAALGASFIAMPGHKGLYGPQGTGLLLASEGAETIMEGGTGSESRQLEMPDFLPDRLEAGTHNVPGAAGLLEGIRFILEKGENNIFSHEKALADKAAEGLKALDAEVFDGESRGGVLSFNLRGMDCEAAAQALAEKDIAVRAGLHCAPFAHEAAGTLDRGTVRVSFSCFNSEREIPVFLDAVGKIAEKGSK